MKTITTLLLLMVTPSVFANQSIMLTPISIHINAEDALLKLEQTILYPEALLNRYGPVGAKISNKHVSQNVISFTATKAKFLFSKSVFVKGVLATNADSGSCAKGIVGYKLNMNFDFSDDLVKNNVEELQAIICVHAETQSKLTGIVSAKIVIGDRYSSMLGPKAVNLIKAQVSPLLQALAAEIQSLD